jgi:predicted MFS family arabinose efflux permease
MSRLPGTTSAPVRRAPWAALLPGIAALVAVMGISRFVYTPILPDMLAAEVLTLRGAGWVASANFVGYLVGALAASRIPGRLAQSRGLRAGLAVSVLALLAMALLDGIVAWMAVRFVAGPPPHPPPPSVDPPAPRAFHAAVLAYGLFGLGYVIHATYLPAMVRAAGYAPAAASWIWVLVGAVALPSIAFWRGVAQRAGARTAIVGCYLVQGVTALAPLFAGDSIAAAAIAALGLGSTFIPASGLALPFARDLDPAGSARAIGVMTASFGAGQIVGPVAAAYPAERSGFGGPSALACGGLLAAAALMRPRFDAVR